MDGASKADCLRDAQNRATGIKRTQTWKVGRVRVLRCCYSELLNISHIKCYLKSLKTQTWPHLYASQVASVGQRQPILWGCLRNPRCIEGRNQPRNHACRYRLHTTKLARQGSIVGEEESVETCIWARLNEFMAVHVYALRPPWVCGRGTPLAYSLLNSPAGIPMLASLLASSFSSCPPPFLGIIPDITTTLERNASCWRLCEKAETCLAWGTSKVTILHLPSSCFCLRNEMGH